MKLRICHLYPDVLNLYGDRGNIMCMKKRLAWRNIEAEVIEVPIGEKLPEEPCDLYFIGGGQDFEQEVLLEDLKGEKAEKIKQYIEEGKVFLAICGGFQILGKYYETYTGQRCDFIGAIDAYTVGGDQRMIGNFMYRCDESDGGMVITGFENHSGRTYLGEGVRPLGTVLRGGGNNGQDKGEGARYKNVFCTYSHGPVLPKNPAFCDRLMQLAINLRYPDYILPPLEDNFERAAGQYMEKRLGGAAQ